MKIHWSPILAKLEIDDKFDVNEIVALKYRRLLDGEMIVMFFTKDEIKKIRNHLNKLLK